MKRTKKLLKKLLKKRCVFCDSSKGKLLRCKETNRWVHRACLSYAFAETSFPGMEDTAGELAHLLVGQKK